MNSTLTFILVAVVTLAASYIQGATGFGFGIFAMIFLPKLLLYTEANILSSILSALSALFVAVLMFRKIHWKNIWFPTWGCLFSTYIAVSFIKGQSSQMLSLFLGIALFLLSIYFFLFSDKIKIKPTWYAGLIAGILSGILGGMFAIGGPPVVIYFMQSEDEFDQYFATISAYFVFLGIVSVSTKVAAGFMTVSVWTALAISMVTMLVGSYIGKRTKELINPNMVKKSGIWVHGNQRIYQYCYIACVNLKRDMTTENHSIYFGHQTQKKAHLFRLLLIRKFNTTFVGTGVLDCPQQKNFSRDITFSADLCYNGIVT